MEGRISEKNSSSVILSFSFFVEEPEGIGNKPKGNGFSSFLDENCDRETKVLLEILPFLVINRTQSAHNVLEEDSVRGIDKHLSVIDKKKSILLFYF